MKIPENMSAYLWGGFIGAIALAIVGFSWGGWVTGGSATKQAATAAHDAVVAALVPVCVQRFQAQADSTMKTADLVKSSSWERGKLVEKTGFAMIQGNASVESDVARACAELLTTPPKPKA